jgi:hypothetical protein
MEVRSCTAEDVVVETAGRMLAVRLAGSVNLLTAARTIGAPLDPESVALVAGWLRELLNRVREVPLAACPFEGEVEVTVERNGHAWWACPLCGAEYHESLTKGEMAGD